MRATTIHAAGDIRFGEVPDPELTKPTDAIIQVHASCVCGSDLWPYRGQNPITAGATIGHEAIGVVTEVGAEVTSVRAGDFVVVPFCHSDNTCPHCRAGVQSACQNLGFTVSGQAEYALVTQADGSLISVPDYGGGGLDKALLSLSDVMATGWHAAVSARVRPGGTVAVVGDGAVGLCGVLAAATMGAETVISMSRHADRQQVARTFGATHVVEERGKEATARVHELTDGLGVDAVLECVGTDESMRTAVAIARPGGVVGYVGVPHGVRLPVPAMFGRNVGLAGGMAPVRAYLPMLVEKVLAGELDPSPVFDLELPLAEVAEAYRAMDERRAIKALLRP
ncbi:zinc-binding dehydrogenase [Nocardioides limicola]|uniref:zinc-binding dehydrogenase n=1 Tax=Nocardioides limicola TaxID=2803368 RepID=UPI00193B9D69|nr:zinc-binding dehydrogenase [Nocardioides sp. DJM-14]